MMERQIYSFNEGYGEQAETKLIVKPLTNYMLGKGWRVKKIHGNAFSKGFPDLFTMHPDYTPRWIECKVVRNGTVHFTPTQEKEFPQWIVNGCNFWVIAAEDLRNNEHLLSRAYALLFKEPNAHLIINKYTRKTFLPMI